MNIGRLVALLAVVLALGVTGITQVIAADDRNGRGSSASDRNGGNPEASSSDEVSTSSHNDNRSEILWAVIRGDGSIARDHGADSADRLNTGGYEVIFDRNVRDCAYTATLGNTGAGDPDPGEIAVARRSDQDNGVWIATFDSDGNFDNHPFHLVVTC